ncbi:acireductone synthase [Brasilonema octagenarum]|uniref:Enolase-phosphatase E1 n=1 Tax=Brasilonema octagenarum UFV-OR1 TaxID=417115 RepID=A0ABX1M9K5_9CYAN|nr:acireductone synthase [Brasilonema octagenarum]NMF65285.1 acireductone synthase [Brasilonema octagenarum UFV-OR1]
MSTGYSNTADVILLDIEGTTTPVDYVFGVLFPFARDYVADFLTTHQQDAQVQTDLQWLRQEYETDLAQGLSVPDWQETEVTGAVRYIHHLIAIDRKSTGLKSLQGKIWDQGYRDGTLRSQMFADVKPAFERWTTAGKRLFIFSSGSVQAQQLLFRHSEVGDLTVFISGYFDTQTGSKKEAESYRKIADAIGIAPEKILFISDVTAELKAAQVAGMQTLFSIRLGDHSSDSEGFAAIHNFDNV